MGLVESMRDKLDVKVFNKIASTGTLITESVTYNDYGDKVISAESSVSISIIPYNFFTGRLNYQSFGTLDEGDMDIIVRYDSTINTKDKITFNSTDYEVKAVEDYFLLGGSLAKAVRVTKLIA